MKLLGVLSTLFLAALLATATVGMPRKINPEFFYFPDQTEYLKLALRCDEDKILWPGTGQCFREGEQGPCNIDRVLTFDKKLLKPSCVSAPGL